MRLSLPALEHDAVPFATALGARGVAPDIVGHRPTRVGARADRCRATSPLRIAARPADRARPMPDTSHVLLHHEEPADGTMGFLVIDLVAWDDRRREIHGFVELTGTRLSDMLATDEPLNATDVTIIDHESGAIERRDFMAIEPGELAVVLATGPRGARSLRQPAVGELAEVHVGQSVIHGVLYTGGTQISFDRSTFRRWLPVTDAVLERRMDGTFARERFGVLIVNRDRVDAVSPLTSTVHETRWLAARPPVAWPTATLRPLDTPRRSVAALVGSTL
jgi:hypothetical protein